MQGCQGKGTKVKAVHGTQGDVDAKSAEWHGWYVACGKHTHACANFPLETWLLHHRTARADVRRRHN